MFQKEKILDDLARVAGGTMSAVSGLSQQLREEIRVRVNEMATRMDFVPREDFEKLETIVIAQSKRVDALEGKKKDTTKTKNKTTTKKK